MTINYPLHVQERFARLLEQRAVQAKKAKAVRAESVKLERAESGPLSPADVHNDDGVKGFDLRSRWNNRGSERWAFGSGTLLRSAR
jgi:hypothetical protein